MKLHVVNGELEKAGEERRSNRADRRQRGDRRQGFNPHYLGPYRRMQLDRRDALDDRRMSAEAQDEAIEPTLTELPALGS